MKKIIPNFFKVCVVGITCVALTTSSVSANAAASGGSAPAPMPAPASTPSATPSATPSTSTSPSATPSASTSTSSTPSPSAAAKTLDAELTAIRVLLAANNFAASITELKRLDGAFPNNADINNYLGFSTRKLKDYKQAAAYYEKALKINPNHKGALEYQGELFVMTNKIALAKKNLAKLKQICGVNCEEYLDLKKAIGSK